MLKGLLTLSLAAMFTLSVQLPSSAVKVARLDGFQEAKWGQSIPTAVTKLGKKFKLVGYLDDKTPFFRGDFGGYRHCDVYTWFKAAKLYKVRVDIKAQDGKNTLDIFVDCSNKLDAVYGEPTLKFDYAYYGEEPQAPENEADEDRWARILGDVLEAKAYIWRKWTFPDGNEILIETIRLGDNESASLCVGISYKSPDMEAAADRSTLIDF
ncbi:MAG: hypothetical protein ACK46X_07925 [Candidatus Sericytochromatia bacterium]